MSKNAIGIDDVLTDFRRELVLVRKYGNAPPNPRNEGFTRQRVFFRFLSKNSMLTSDNKYYPPNTGRPKISVCIPSDSFLWMP